jgi:glyoxylase-like metal-dependent hydrolase (beta-lactamase superfamily II)
MNRVAVLVEGYSVPTEVDGKYKVAGTVTLIRGDNAIVVADPGMVSDRALILEALNTEGLSPEEVTHVFISHHHPDHTVSVALFPSAEVVDFWAIYKGDVWQDHGDEYEIAPGITVLRTPGHSKEDASLIVETEEGIYALTHAWWRGDRTPSIDPLAWSQDELEESREKILATADRIIPGHGALFMNS